MNGGDRVCEGVVPGWRHVDLGFEVPRWSQREIELDWRTRLYNKTSAKLPPTSARGKRHHAAVTKATPRWDAESIIVERLTHGMTLCEIEKAGGAIEHLRLRLVNVMGVPGRRHLAGLRVCGYHLTAHNLYLFAIGPGQRHPVITYESLR